MFRKLPLIASLALLMFVSFGCSKVPENNDPVIGIWARTETQSTSTLKGSVREEWIFNDVYLGRYHRYEGGALQVQSDFRWSVQAGTYTVEYPGLERPNDRVSIRHDDSAVLLVRPQGEPMARRE